jgi:hypothetical protein
MRNTILTLAVASLVCVFFHKSEAGSAVAWDGGSHLGSAYGGPMEMAEQRALENCRRRGGVNARIFAATDVTGYGAIAIGSRPNGGSVLAVSLGKRSATEADSSATQHCLKAGGINPKVRWAWRG